MATGGLQKVCDNWWPAGWQWQLVVCNASVTTGGLQAGCDNKWPGFLGRLQEASPLEVGGRFFFFIFFLHVLFLFLNIWDGRFIDVPLVI